MKEVPKQLYHGTNLLYCITQLAKHDRYQHDDSKKVQMSDEFGGAVGHAIRSSVQHNTGLPTVLVVYSKKLDSQPGFIPGDSDGLDSKWVIEYLPKDSYKVFPILGDYRLMKRDYKT